MRWGVRDEATDDHVTTGLCLQEIDNCQRLSVGPNFCVSPQFSLLRTLSLSPSTSASSHVCSVCVCVRVCVRACVRVCVILLFVFTSPNGLFFCLISLLICLSASRIRAYSKC